MKILACLGVSLNLLSISLLTPFVQCVSGVSYKTHNERRAIKRVQVTFTEEQWRLIEKFKGVMGSDDAEIVRNIVLAWLSEKSVVSASVKESMHAEKGGRA